MFRLVFALGCVGLLAGCATQPEAFHRLQSLPKATVNASSSEASRASPPVVEYAPSLSASGYREWTMSSERLSRIRRHAEVQYVQEDWRTIKKSDQKVVDCIHDTQQRLSNGNEQWMYVVGKGYTRQAVVLQQSPACWSRLSADFQQDWSSAAAHVGSDNPLTRYDAALVHWIDFCQETAITSKGLNACMDSHWIQTIQSRKAAVSEYVSDQSQP